MSFEPVTFKDAAQIVDLVIAALSGRWFLPGTRERAIEAVLNAKTERMVLDDLAAELERSAVQWRYDDPHDAWAA